MQDKILSPRLALNQRTASLEQALERGAGLFARIPLRTWKNLVILLLVLWLSFSLSRFFWLVVPDPVIPVASVALVPGSTGAPATAGDLNIDALKSLDIFGEADQAAIAAANEAQNTTQNNFPAGMEDNAVDTQLNLLLVGVVASNDESAGRAIIATGGKQEVYGPGAELPAGRGVTLTRVLDTRVILNNNGRLESLWLHQDDNDPRARANLRSAAPPVDAGGGRSWSEENEVVEDSQQAVFVGQGNELQEASPAAVNPESEVARNISDVVAMSIHREGGQVVGYKIRPGRNADQFAALGLQPDDIVTAVNGTPLNNPGKIMEIYTNMRNATSANLEIKRGGSVLSIDVVLQ